MKSSEQELREGNYDIHDVLNDETSERRVFLARMGRDVEALAGTLESDVLVALTENGYAEDYPTIALGQLDMLLDASKQPGREGDLASQEVYDLKRGSLIVKPTTIERTMLPSEFYKMGNPLWARNASIKQIANMKLYESEARHEGNFELFLEQFDKLLAVAHDYMRGVNIMRTSGAGMPF